jgi:predicted PurR-regulated permease PerM
MKKSLINRITLIVMIVIISASFIVMIYPFLMAIFMAGLLSAMARPFHQWLTMKLRGRKYIASALTIIALITLILVPLTALTGVVVSQAISVGQSVTPWIESFIREPSTLDEFIEMFPHYEQLLPYRDMIFQKAGQAVGMISNMLAGYLSSMTMVTVTAIFNIIIMLYTMFYFLIMGDTLLNRILYYLPMTHADEERLLNRFTSVARATMKTTIIIGVIQGGICGFAFWLVGIQSAVFWGTVMAVMSIIPAFGTAIIWVPTLIILALSGDFSGVLILLVLCGGIAGNLDNVLRPRLVGRDTKMHDLFVLFGTLGGIAMFGILGIIIGPIISALFITIWEIYGESFQEYLPRVELRKKEILPESEEEIHSTEEKGQNS